MAKRSGGLWTAFVLSAALGWTSAASAQKAVDVSMPGDDGRSYHAKLYVPAKTPAPGMLVLHTFYGVINGKAEKPDQAYGAALAKQGFVALVPDYISPALKNRPHQPAVVRDLAHMAKWLGARPELGGKPVGAVGFSIGALFAARLASTEPSVKTIVCYYGYYDYRTFGPTAARKLPPGPVETVDRVQAAVLLLHGTADDETPHTQAVDYKAALEKAGKTVELVSYQGAYHRFDRGPSDRMKRERSREGHLYRLDVKARDDAWKRTLAFLRAHLD